MSSVSWTKSNVWVLFSGTADSNVKCRPCRSGMFSATFSDTDSCQPHTKWVQEAQIMYNALTNVAFWLDHALCLYRCHGSAVVREGNATADTVCEHQGLTTTQPQKTTKTPDTSSVFMTSSTMSSIVLANSDSTLAALFNHSTKSPPAEPTISWGMVQ